MPDQCLLKIDHSLLVETILIQIRKNNNNKNINDLNLMIKIFYKIIAPMTTDSYPRYMKRNIKPANVHLTQI